MILTSLAPSFGHEPSTGTPANLALPRPYNNLAIGGCAIHGMLAATTAADASGCNGTIDLVLRNSALKLGSQVDQAVALSPTFVFLENLGNDYLGAVTSGSVIDGVTVTPLASFTADTNAAVAKLATKQPKGIVFGVVDITNVAFTTTLPPFLTSGGKLVLNPATGAADPAPRAEVFGGHPGLPDPGHDARHAQRRGISAVRLRHSVRGRPDAAELQQAPPGLRPTRRETRAPSSTRPTWRSSRSAARTTTLRSRPRPTRTATSTTTRTCSSQS